ncbi:homoserine O-succinyltransferase MetX [Tahibacter amnicola]|uniref:Homoserine O-succinyltransferase n=1 Tax=Tahibacter amnicola TaxID=2976241 RepID=A0ABY6BC37_9GAMM|nr:homoserine O-succinyltransferase [Tahibacter amnicola]UXI67608.1 homoserine O-succinyltransferase [Tahibacter amnicola]
MSLSILPALAYADDAFVAFDSQPAIARPQRMERAETVIRLSPRYGNGPVDVAVRYLWIGAEGAPTVIVQGGISASRDVCTHAEGNGYWDDLVGAARPVDLTRWRVLSIEWLAQSDLGPASAVSSEDQADALAALLDTLQVAKVHAFIGASYGAMVGLAFASRHPARAGKLVAISGAHRAHPLATALRAIQREIVRNGLAAGTVDAALGLARQLAMTTYRGAEEFAERFDAEPEFRDGRFHFPVEDYLCAAGRKFVARFDAQRYLSLSESIDLHRIDPATVKVPTDVVAVSSDRLVPAQDLRDLAAAIAAPSAYREIDSRYGHDAFLKEPERIGTLVARALCC